MNQDFEGQVIALAAIFQFASQVETLAKTGYLEADDLEVATASLLCQTPPETIAVYGKISHLEQGLQALLGTLQRKASKSTDCIRYVMGIIHLQKRLQKHPTMLGEISSKLARTQQQLAHFSATHDNIIAGLADTYSNTISSFNFRIQVMGEYQYLQQNRIANQIRTLLFAGIRSAVLWRQLGGNRLKVIFKRKAIILIAERLLENAKQEKLH